MPPKTTAFPKPKSFSIFKLIFECGWLLLLVICFSSGCVTAKKPLDDKAKTADEDQLPNRILQAKIRSDIQSYADRFASVFIDKAFSMERQLPTAKLRLSLAHSRVATLASVFDIAAGYYPGVALLDMIVLVSLKRIVWEDYWLPKVYGPSAAGMVEMLRKYEKIIWDLSSQALNAKQQRELREVIAEWRAANPDQIFASFIRFSDFGELGHKPALKTAVQPGGLFNQVSEATRAVDEVRLTGERAMYLFSRMQLVAGLQIDMLYKNLVTQPEIVQLMYNADRLSELSEDLHALLKSLPQNLNTKPNKLIDKINAHVTEQRKALIDHLMDRVGQERQNLIQDLNSEEKVARALLKDMRSTLATGNEMATSLNQTMLSVNALASRFEGLLPEDGSKVNITELRGLATDFSQTIQKLNSLLQSVDQMLFTQMDEQSFAQKSAALLYFFDVKAKEWLVHAMILGFIFLLAVLTTLLIYRYIWIRISSSSPPRDTQQSE